MALEVIDLCKSYGHGKKQKDVIDNLSFKVEEGEMVALAGKKRSGKTVVLNILAGIDAADSGTVLLNGKKVNRKTFLRLGRYRSKDVGIITKEPMLLPELTILENVALSLQHRFMSAKEKRKMAREALRTVGLKGKGKFYPHELSILEQQLACTARAIVHHPKFLLADEPTACLESFEVERYMEVLEVIATGTGCGVVVATFSRRVATLCRRIIPVNGQSVSTANVNAEGTADEVPGHTLVGSPTYGMESVEERAARERYERGEEEPASENVKLDDIDVDFEEALKANLTERLQNENSSVDTLH